MAERKPVTIGIVGAGDIVASVHLPVLRALDGVTPSWITDRSLPAAEAAGAANGVTPVALPDDLCLLPEADVYLLAIPHGARDPYLDVFRARGGAVYVEKPAATTLAELDTLVAGFPPERVASGLMMRCWGPNLHVRAAVDAQLFGRLRRVRYGYGHPGLVTGGRYYFDRSQGGGGLVGELAIHGIDSAVFCSGADQLSDSDVVAIEEDGSELHGAGEFLLRTPGGDEIECELVVSSLAETIEGIEGIELQFDSATVSYQLPGYGYALTGDTADIRPIVTPARGGLPHHMFPLSGTFHPGTKPQMFACAHERFLAGIADGVPNETSAESSRLTTALVEALSGQGPRDGDR